MASQSALFSWSRSTRTPRRRRPRAAGRSADRRHSSAPAPGSSRAAARRLAQGRAQLGDVDRPVPGEPAGRGDGAGQHGGQQRLVELDHRLALGQPPPHARRAARRGPRPATGRGHAGRRSRPAPGHRAAAPAVAASVHGPATAILTGPGVALGVLLEQVQVRPQGARWPADGRGPSRRSAASRPAAGRRRARRAGRSTDRSGPRTHRAPEARAGTAAPGTRRRRS